MAISRQKKEEITKKVAGIVKDSGSVVFVNFHGLTVGDATVMRQGLKEKRVNYFVAKKTLIKRVLDDLKIEGKPPALEGELALAYGEDLVLPAQSVIHFQKKFKDSILPLGGIFEGKYIDKNEVGCLAAIPSREVLYGQFVTVLNSPIQQAVGALNAITQSFVSALHQIGQSKT